MPSLQNENWTVNPFKFSSFKTKGRQVIIWCNVYLIFISVFFNVLSKVVVSFKLELHHKYVQILWHFFLELLINAYKLNCKIRTEHVQSSVTVLFLNYPI